MLSILIHPFLTLIVELEEKALRKGGLVLNIANVVYRLLKLGTCLANSSNWTSEGNTNRLALGSFRASF